MVRTLFLIATLPAMSCARWALAIDDVSLADGVAVQFAAQEGAKALVAEDDFVRALSKFDRQARLQTGEEVSLEAWKKFAAGEVRDWEDGQAERVRQSLDRLRARLATLKLPLPERILLIHTTGREEGSAAYTRGAAIVLPDKVLAYTQSQLDRLLVHELFHVLSGHNPNLKRDLYATIGFRPCPPLTLPGSLADRKITNPDAPLVDCYIEIQDGGKSYFGAPVLYASSKSYDAKRGGTLFSYFTFRLLVIERRGSNWEPVLVGDQPVVIDPRSVDSFHKQIGKNTNYIIHPDEILADNFVHLVMGDENLATPKIVEDMRKLLSN